MDYKVDESDFKFAIYVDNKVDDGKPYIQGLAEYLESTP